jgi:hypothetical protein
MKYRSRNREQVIQFRYEDFCKQPEKFGNQIAAKLSLTMTKLTARHIGEVYSKPSNDLEIPVSSIAQPERDKFKKLNERLGYKV